MFIFGSIRQENLGDSLKSVVELRHIRFQDFQDFERLEENFKSQDMHVDNSVMGDL